MPIILPGIISAQQQGIKVPGQVLLRRTTKNTNSAGVSSFLADIPIGAKTGDILVAAVGTAKTGNTSQGLGNAEGFTMIQERNHNYVNGSKGAGLMWKEYDSVADPAQFTFTSAQARNWTVHMMVIGSLSSVDPKDISGTAATSGTPLNLPDLTPTAEPTLGIEMFCVRYTSADTNWVSGEPAGSVLELNDINTAHSDTDGDFRLYIATKDWATTDPTGVRAYTLNDRAGTTVNRCAGIHALLKG
jgi:hypothetical protein